MSRRDDYPHGVPCWVTCLADDVPGAADFYAALFGWTYVTDDDQSYAVALLDGQQVAGIGSRSEAGPEAESAWITAVRVDDAAASAEQARAAGGTVLAADLDMSPAGRLSVVSDPTGATITAWQAGDRFGAERVNEPGAWAMSLLQTPDPDRARSFYAETFGWQAEAFGPVELFRKPGYVGGEPQQPVPRDVIAAMAPCEGPAVWAVDFWVSDAEAVAETAAAHGGAVLEPVHDEANFRRARLRDPEGAEFTVSQLVLS